MNYYRPENFSLRYCFWLFFFMFACDLSLEWLDESQPIFTQFRCRGGLAQTLLKMGIIGLAVSQPSWKNSYECSCCTGVAFTLAQALDKCHPLYSVHRFQLP